jgi:methylmalonyl-CoA/ethylmalonyl-CoA epimerase
MESLLKRVDHLGIAVRDLTTAMATYSATLGLRDWETIELPERSMRVAVGDTLIELIAPTGPEAAFTKFLAERGEGLHHVAYEVEDIDQALQILAEQGVRLIDSVARPGIHHTRIAFVHPKETLGVLTELVEHPASDR